MLIIQGNETRIDTMKYNTGAFFGQNFVPTWNSHFKSNINLTSISISKNLHMDSVNIINDQDGLDFIGKSSDFVHGFSLQDNDNLEWYT